MNSNAFELTGRVSFVDFKSLESGNTKTRVLISKKGRKEGEYETYPITFFGETAEKVFSNIKKGDSLYAKGKLGYNKFVDKAGNSREQIELVGFDFVKVEYDAKANKYVPVGGETSESNPWDN